MALDYHKCAQEIADNIGGGANVVSAAHCATRLRLVIADNGKVNKAALEESRQPRQPRLRSGNAR